MSSAPGPSFMKATDPNFEEWALKVYDELDIDELQNVDSDDDEMDTNFQLESDNDSRTEESASESDPEDNILGNEEYYIGKNGYKW